MSKAGKLKNRIARNIKFSILREEDNQPCIHCSRLNEFPIITSNEDGSFCVEVCCNDCGRFKRDYEIVGEKQLLLYESEF